MIVLCISYMLQYYMLYDLVFIYRPQRGKALGPSGSASAQTSP